MAFSVSDFQDLLALLRQNPEWLAELRQLIIADDFQRIEAGLDRIREEMHESRKDFDERMRAFDERLKSVDQRIDLVVVSQERMQRTLNRLETNVGHFNGFLVEERFRRNAAGYFGRRLRKAHVFAAGELALVREANDSDALSDTDWAQLNEVDFVVVGTERGGTETGSEVAFAVEASAVIDLHDVNRAVQRAEILSRIGYDGRPAVGGASILADARDLAARLNVAVILNPRLSPATTPE